MKKLIITATAFIVFFGLLAIPKINLIEKHASPKVLEMPIVQDTNPYTSQLKCATPYPHRETEYIKYLAASVKIFINAGKQSHSGSGTIIYYDHKTQEAYVASCGHLWTGEKTAEQLAKNPLTCKIIVWYHNNEKLSSTKEYDATVLFYNNSKRGLDTSLMKFKADWVPEYFPIAKTDYNVAEGSHHHSCGCDDGQEVARYDVEIIGYRSIIDNAWRDTGEIDLTTTKNSPRPGRSGGGLLSSDGYYIGTCWGTAKPDGSGIGYFTPLKAIHKMYKKNGFEWLLTVGKGLAKKVPIFDKNDPKKIFTEDYIKTPDNPVLVPR